MQISAHRSERSLQRDRQRQRQEQALALEQARKDALPFYDRIEEAELSGDLKDILHIMARKLGLED